jgi:hypothetical protein
MKTFYHFTSLERLPAIKREGLRLGDVPTSARSGENGVWLTTDSSPSGHGLSVNREMTSQERHFVLSWKGVLPPEGTRFEDRTAVRIVIRKMPDIGQLVRWKRWGRRNCKSGIYDALIRGGGTKHGSWYVFFGIIPPENFAAIEFRNADLEFFPQAEP